MTALKKEELKKLELEYGLEEDELTYQQRCSRITAYQKGEGESWKPNEKKHSKFKKNKNVTHLNDKREEHQLTNKSNHSLYGKKIIICPLIAPDKNRSISYKEEIGHVIDVEEANAGSEIANKGEDVRRMVSDYNIVSVVEDQPIYAKTGYPKIGTEISYTIGKDIVPMVRGNDGQEGYIWAFPSRTFQVTEDTAIQVYGLRTVIKQLYPELMDQFSGLPMMRYIDGVTLAASREMTHELLKKARRKKLQNKKLGLE